MDAKKQKNKLTSWYVRNPTTSGFLVFLLFFFIVGFIVFQRYLIIIENDKREMSNVLHIVYENVDKSLKNSTTAALTLALTINDDGVPENFNTIGRQLIVSNPDIDAVELVPKGVINYIYPLEGNKPALGLNILEDKENKAGALKAIKTGKMYFAGPLNMRQGGIGVIGRLPVFKNDTFWGFSGVLLRMENLIKVSGIHSMDESKYYFQFSHVNTVTKRTEFFLPNKADFSDKYSEVVTFPDSDWKLYIISKDESNIFFQLLPLAVCGTLLALLFGFIISTLLRKPAELQLQVLKQARRLLNNEVKYKAIFEQAAVGIANIDVNSGNFINVNEQFCKMLGYTNEEIDGINIVSVIHPDDLNSAAEHIEILKLGEVKCVNLEQRYITKSGNIVWVNVAASPLWKSDETPNAIIAIAEDITLTKQNKELISKSEARFKSLFEDSPIALWEEDFSLVKKHIVETYPHLDASNAEAYFESHPEEVDKCIALVKIIDVNNECLQLHYPSTKKELLEANLVGLLDTDSLKSFIKQLAAVVSNAKMLTINTTIKTTDGDYKDIYLRWSVMRGYEDSLERVIISTEDITAQKASERIILDSQLRIETLIDTIDGIVWESDYQTYEFTFVNKKAEEILGYPVSEWLHDAAFWPDKIHPDDREWALAYCLAQSATKSQYDFEYRMIAKDGSIIWLRDIVNVVKENGKPISLKGIMIDITETKEAENDLNASLELVTEQKKRLMNFSYIVSHNLRSHTANIQSILNLISDCDSDEEKDEMIDMLRTVADSLNETMINLNDLVNVQTNITIGREPLNVKHYIETAEHALSEQIDSIGVEIVNNVPNHATAQYNPAYLESVLLNLVSNAIRYRHAERNPIVTFDWLQDQGKDILTVSDNGIGIDLSKHGDKLFGMYKTFNGNSDARGIGLFMTKSQVEAMDGKITVESEPGKGTTFKVWFA